MRTTWLERIQMEIDYLNSIDRQLFEWSHTMFIMPYIFFLEDISHETPWDE